MSDQQRLTTEAARRLAARTQWQKALTRARERFAPAAVKNELVEKAADTVVGIADETARLAWAHKGKIAAVAAIAGLVAARKPVIKALAPIAGKLRAKIGRPNGDDESID